MSFNFEAFVAGVCVTFLMLLLIVAMTFGFAVLAFILGTDPWVTGGICWGIMLTVGVVVGVLDN